MKRAQGAFEYILLLGGVLLIVVVAIIILRGSVLNQANKQIAGNTNAWQSVTCIPTFMSSSGNVRGLWRFDGDYSDSSGKGNNGVPSGPTVTFVPGKHGQAISLPGSADYVGVSDNPTLSLPNTGYTIEAWVYLPNTALTNVVLSRRDDCSNANYQLGTDSINRVYFYSTVQTDMGTGPSANQWVHMAIVYNAGTVTHYLNGQPKGSGSPGYSSTGNAGLRIGTDGTCGSDFTGYIDDVVLYDKALSQQEIQQDMNCVG